MADRGVTDRAPLVGRTLPSLLTMDSVGSDRRALRATVVFHPDPERIGAFVDLTTWECDAPRPSVDCEVGRLAPELSDGQPLLEPHVSRRALRVCSARGGITLTAAAEGVRCRIGAAEGSTLWAAEDTLLRGVPVRLGHGVVLLLRQVVLPAPRPAVDSAVYPGSSVESEGVRQSITAAACAELPVLLLGESGVGKELVAQAIHVHSARQARPWVAVNMAAIPESLAAAELFGSARGAYTGAQSRPGLFREAHQGTLFLDEVGDTPPQVQAQLLRTLQEQEVRVLGGGVESIDVRVIAATDADIDDDSVFRNALRQRLAGLTIPIPPLRERLEDIGPQLLQALQLAGDEVPDFFALDRSNEPETAARLARAVFGFLTRDWRGNSRELQHAVGEMLLQAGDDSATYATVTAEMASAVAIDDRQLSVEFEIRDYEIAKVARDLGMSRQTLYRRLEAHPELRIAASVTEAEFEAAIAEVGPDPRALSRYLRVSVVAMTHRLRRRDGGKR